MKLIERYVYDVTRRLPEATREEVKLELTANINDMLSENPTEEEIKDVLETLGHPRLLANSYRDEARFLISPEWMDEYWMVLKIVLIVLGVIGLVSGLVDSLINLEETGIFIGMMTVLGQSIGSTISSLLGGFAVVTLIFYSISHLNKTRVNNFEVKNLPELPKTESRTIKKASIIASLVMNVILGSFFIYLIVTDGLHVFWLNGSFEITTGNAIFTESVINGLLPLVIISVIAAVIKEIYFLFKNEWDLKAYAVYATSKVITTTIAIIFMTSNNLLNFELVEEIAGLSGMNANELYDILGYALIGLSALTGIGTAADLITTGIKKLKTPVIA